MKKAIVVCSISAALLSSVSLPTTSSANPADPINQKATGAISTNDISWTVKLRVGETYQLPYYSGTKYYPFPNGGKPYFSVSSTGLVTILERPSPAEWKPIGAVGIVVNGRDLGEISIIIID
ncbi:hypothetical protein [Paenibacillus sp. FSL K6-1230]|uniref:hypothetical protein n=1 Tax=Paenibacillus sp. FSL K6-1230 TaxID=2921603 RepID=UPI0030F6E02F